MTGKTDTSKKDVKDEGGLGARGAAGKRKKAAAAGERKKAAAATGGLQRPPNAPPSAFVLFMTEFRQEYSAQHPEDNSELAVTKAAAAKWRDMSEQEKQPFVDQADEKRQQYFDEHEPKPPPSAFVLFVTEYRKEYKAQRPIRSEFAVIEEATEKWAHMSEQEKQPFVDQADQKKKQYFGEHEENDDDE